MVTGCGRRMGRERSHGNLLVPPADTGLTEAERFMNEMVALFQPQRLRTNNSFPSNFLQGYLKTGFICI